MAISPDFKFTYGAIPKISINKDIGLIQKIIKKEDLIVIKWLEDSMEVDWQYSLKETLEVCKKIPNNSITRILYGK